MALPEYSKLDLTQCHTYHGYYTLGLIKQYRPDIEIITFKLARHDQWADSDHDVTFLKTEIDNALLNNKIVLFVPWEEDVMGERDYALTDLLNSYKDRPLYFVSEMDSQGQLIFKDYHKFECKILELPFVLVNDCICYDQVRYNLNLPMPAKSNLNFLCMIGRPEGHKFDLAESLIANKLDQFGLITSMDQNNLDLSINKQIPRYEVNQLLTVHRKEAAQKNINGVWVSSNVENFLHIESTYDMPLIINPESTMGIFPATEKSIWPALIGKLFLIQAQAGIMAYIQRFYTVDQSQYANLDFDKVYGWDHNAHNDRRTNMIINNADLIKDASYVYSKLYPELQNARKSFVVNMYNFFVEQVKKIV